MTACAVSNCVKYLCRVVDLTPMHQGWQDVHL